MAHSRVHEINGNIIRFHVLEPNEVAEDQLELVVNELDLGTVLFVQKRLNDGNVLLIHRVYCLLRDTDVGRLVRVNGWNDGQVVVSVDEGEVYEAGKLVPVVGDGDVSVQLQVHEWDVVVQVLLVQVLEVLDDVRRFEDDVVDVVGILRVGWSGWAVP